MPTRDCIVDSWAESKNGQVNSGEVHIFVKLVLRYFSHFTEDINQYFKVIAIYNVKLILFLYS
jgi:hypothetical protein